MIKLLFLSFRLIFATTQPSAHESASTNREMSATSSTPPAMAAALAEIMIQYTMTAGRMTTPEYIRPMR